MTEDQQICLLAIAIRLRCMAESMLKEGMVNYALSLNNYADSIGEVIHFES